MRNEQSLLKESLREVQLSFKSVLFVLLPNITTR